MALRLVVVVPVFEAAADDDGFALLLINACADVATSAQTAARSKMCAFVMITLYAMNYGRDRLAATAAAAANERRVQEKRHGRLTL